MRVGDVVAGRFELEALIGSGGMGDVHRAIDRTSGERVAIKSLRTQGGDADRFLREARVLEELAHPAIVRHLAHGESDGALFLAMEWLEGEDLGKRLGRAPLTVAESLTLVTRIAEALALVHARGVLHRDLKPSNLFLRGGVVEQVKILDFGIARVAGAGARTVTGTALGTPGYMAPEQARGERTVDARADVFALGCVLFECLTGRPAFAGDHAIAILGKILFEEAARLREVRPEVSPDLDALVARMLSKDPSLRPADGGALLVELLTLGTQSGAAPRPSARPPMLTDSAQRLLSVVMAREAKKEDAHAATIEAHASDDSLASLRKIANRYGAHIDRVGDGTLVAVVAIRGSATDQSASAARLALDLHAELPNACVIAATGRGVVSDRWPVGDAIERGAALLRELEDAPPSTVTVDSTTAGLVESRFDLRRTDGRIALLRERPIDSARLLLGRPSPCVGRDRELTMLETILAESAQDSVARAVLVTGSPGAGKSRLLSELLRRIGSQKEAPQQWFGRADATRSGSPFGLLGPLLRATMDVREGEPPEDHRARVQSRVARHVEESARPRVCEFLGEMIGVSFPESPGSALQAARRDAQLMSDQMARAFEEFVDGELRAGPLLVALEDIHWGDLPSLTFLDRVLRNSKNRPLTVIAMARPEVRETFPKLWAERDVTEIRLGGLSPRAAERLVRSALGDTFDPARVAAIVERADGNAFYLEELIRAESEGRRDGLPETVLAMVQMRLESLRDDERRALRAASVFGESFWDGGVRALIGERTGDTSASLRALVERETVQPIDPSRFPDQREYRFRHAIVREAAYALLTDDDRKLGHRLAAKWLTAVSEHDAAALADHHRRGGAIDLAIACYVRAADQSLDANDLASASARAEDGIACGASGRALGELRRVQADVHRWSGRMVEAVQAAGEAMDLLEPGSIGWCKAAEASAQAPVCEGGSDDRARTERLVARLLEVEPRQGAAAHLCIAMCMVARSMFLVSRFDVGRRFYARIEPLAQLLGGADPFVEAQLAQMRGVWARMEGDTSRAVQLAELSIAKYEALGATRQVLFVKTNLTDCLLQLAEWRRAIDVTRPLVPAAQKMGLDVVAIVALLNVAIALAQVGEIDEALARLDEVMQLCRTQGNLRYQCVARCYLAEVLALANRLDAAAEAAREAVTATETFPSLHPQALGILAHVELRRGHVEEALQLSRRAMDLLASLGNVLEGAELVRLTHASALHRSGAVSEAKLAIADARDRILRSAALIGDPALRDGFLQRVSANAETLRLAAEWLR